ncbi:hypothetical protein SAMN05216255_3117 [Pseudomonas segetis]|uniref:Uncharacterized protein n=1 Tax=Pseudomonas segetis TaxID=298908 RepID=A0A239GRH5_9PSED|nr:hypothetical protein SAMN05216255_3117 [Pseudomonas segetis]
MGLQCRVKMFVPALLHVTGIPNVKFFLCFWAEPECSTRLGGQPIEVVNKLFHALSGVCIRPAVDQTPFAHIVGVYGQLQALSQAVIQFAADGSVYKRCDS